MMANGTALVRSIYTPDYDCDGRVACLYMEDGRPRAIATTPDDAWCIIPGVGVVRARPYAGGMDPIGCAFIRDAIAHGCRVFVGPCSTNMSPRQRIRYRVDGVNIRTHAVVWLYVVDPDTHVATEHQCILHIPPTWSRMFVHTGEVAVENALVQQYYLSSDDSMHVLVYNIRENIVDGDFFGGADTTVTGGIFVDSHGSVITTDKFVIVDNTPALHTLLPILATDGRPGRGCGRERARGPTVDELCIRAAGDSSLLAPVTFQLLATACGDSLVLTRRERVEGTESVREYFGEYT